MPTLAGMDTHRNLLGGTTTRCGFTPRAEMPGEEESASSDDLERKPAGVQPFMFSNRDEKVPREDLSIPVGALVVVDDGSRRAFDMSDPRS
jgi:hypothetical protein